MKKNIYRIGLCVIAFNFVAVANVQSEVLIAGFHTWDPAALDTVNYPVGDTWSNGDVAPGVTATFRKLNSSNGVHGSGSTDDTYGTFSTGSPLGAVGGSEAGASQKMAAGESEYNIEMFNSTGADIELTGIHYDVGTFLNGGGR